MYGGVGNRRAYKPTYVKKSPAQRSYESALVAATKRAENARFGQKKRMYAAAVAAQETKYFDTSFVQAVTWAGSTWADSEVPMSTYINSSGTAAAYTDSALIPSANGSAYGQVEGTKYKLQRVRVKGRLNVAPLTAQMVVGNNVAVRLLLVEDLMPGGAQGQGEDILQDYGALAENFSAFMRIPSALGKYRILKDKSWILQPSVAANNAAADTISYAYSGVQFKLGAKWFGASQDVMIKAGNATPTINGLISKNVFMLVAGVNVATGTAVAVTITGCSRAYYKD